MQEMEEDGGDESDEEIRELKRRFDEKILSVLRTNHPAGWRWEDQSWGRRAPKTKSLLESSGNWEHVQIKK